MNEHDLTPLPPDVDALLRASPRPAPPLGLAEGLLERIHASLGPGPGGSGGGNSVGQAARGLLAAKMGTWGLPVSLAALAAGTIVGRALPHKEVPVSATPAPVAKTVPTISIALPPPALSIAERPTVKRAIAPRDSAARRDAALAEERSLIEMARAALASGRPNDALEALGRHAQTFPEGQLVEERESLRIQALAAAGQPAEARRQADAFHRRFPDSMFQTAVDEALGPPVK